MKALALTLAILLLVGCATHTPPAQSLMPEEHVVAPALSTACWTAAASDPTGVVALGICAGSLLWDVMHWIPMPRGDEKENTK